MFFACHAFSDLEEGKTYQFDNLVVRREYNTKDIILAKPKTGCKAVETASFKENVIQPFELLKSLTTTTTPTEILGVQSFPAYHSCCQCKKKIILEKSTVITCNICDVKQKVKSTTEQCYIDINAAKVTVTLFHDIIKNLLISQGKHGLPINEDNVTSLFLKLLTLSSSRKAVAKTVKTEQQNKHLFNTCRNCKTKTLNVLVIPTTKINFFNEREIVNFLQL